MSDSTISAFSGPFIYPLGFAHVDPEQKAARRPGEPPFGGRASQEANQDPPSTKSQSQT